jgi:hypothetical protein
VPNIVFIDGSPHGNDGMRPIQTGVTDEGEAIFQARIAREMEYYISIGQRYSVVQAEIMAYFTFRSSFGSCFEEVRDLFMRHLIFNAQCNVTTIPMFYLDVNKVVRYNFPELGIVGNFVITNLSWSLGNLATMTIQSAEAVVIA